MPCYTSQDFAGKAAVDDTSSETVRVNQPLTPVKSSLFFPLIRHATVLHQFLSDHFNFDHQAYQQHYDGNREQILSSLLHLSYEISVVITTFIVPCQWSVKEYG